jgi:hypothetical protein
LSNENGWGAPEYWSTIRMGDVNGDGKADLCARHSAGFSCWLSDGNGFPDQIDGPALSNANGWSAIEYYSTLRLADIDRDGKADLCARAASGFTCWLSQGTSFGSAIEGPDMSDAQGWDKPQYYSTFHVTNATDTSSAAVCGRGSAGVVCWPFDGTKFGSVYKGPEWSDANGWNNQQYYSTFHYAGAWAAPPPATGGTGGHGSGGASGGATGAGANSGGAKSIDPEGRGTDEADSEGCSCELDGRHDTGGALWMVLGAVCLAARRRSASRAVNLRATNRER